jgi:hypothetical protein
MELTQPLMKVCTTAILLFQPNDPLVFMAKLLYSQLAEDDKQMVPFEMSKREQTYFADIWRKASDMNRPRLEPASHGPVPVSVDGTSTEENRTPPISSLEIQPSIDRRVCEDSEKTSAAFRTPTDVQPSPGRRVLERSEPIRKYPAFIRSAEERDDYENHKQQGLCLSLTLKGRLCRRKRGRESYCSMHRSEPILQKG